MKRTICYLLLSVLCVGLSACDSNSSDVDLAVGTMRASIGGSTWEAANATANRMAAGGYAMVTIAGATVRAETVSFTITDTGTGTYTLDGTVTPGGPDALSATYIKTPGDSYVATTGTFEITRKDDEGIEGTFSFEARNQAGQTVSVTDGAFNVGYGVSIGKR